MRYVRNLSTGFRSRSATKGATSKPQPSSSSTNSLCLSELQEDFTLSSLKLKRLSDSGIFNHSPLSSPTLTEVVLVYFRIQFVTLMLETIAEGAALLDNLIYKNLFIYFLMFWCR